MPIISMHQIKQTDGKMNILILGISGLCIGAGVLMSSFFGGGDLQKLKKTLSTLLVFGTVFSSAVAGIGFAAAYGSGHQKGLHLQSEFLTTQSNTSGSSS